MIPRLICLHYTALNEALNEGQSTIDLAACLQRMWK